MARLKVFWTETAISQRNQIFVYWNKRNKSTRFSRKLNAKIKERIALLVLNPEMSTETDFKGIRTSVLIYYSILYKFNNQNFYIMGIWDNRQNPEKLLNFLKRIKS